MRFLLLFALLLVVPACNGCGEPTMTLKSPLAFGQQSVGVPFQTVRVPMAAPQTYVQQRSACTPAAQGVTEPRYVPIN